MSALSWGRHYACVRPDHFRIMYRINPFMDPAHQPDHDLSQRQWSSMIAALTDQGARVDVIEARPDSPDMVYAQNLAFVWSREGRTHALMSTMRHEQRRRERLTAEPWFAGRGHVVHHIDPAFEAGDAFLWRGELLVGYGPRTDGAALPLIEELVGLPVRGIHTVHPAMFHLDLSFCPLTEDTALIAPEAFDRASADLLIDLVPDPIILSIEDALGFAANSVVVGDAVIGDGISPLLAARLGERGLRVIDIDLSQFHLSGGSVRCMTNPLDIVVD